MSSGKNTSSTINASALRAKASGARQSADDQHAAKRAENEARLRGLMAQLALRIMDNLPTQEVLTKLAEQGKSGTVIAIAKPPSKQQVLRHERRKLEDGDSK